MICAVTGRWGGKCCGHDIADDEWFIQATAHAQKVMGVSMRIMSHAVEGLDSNLINNNSNTGSFEIRAPTILSQKCNEFFLIPERSTFQWWWTRS